MSRQHYAGAAVDEGLLGLRDPAIEGDEEQEIADEKWIRQLAMQINNSVSVASANLAVVCETLEAEESTSSDVQDALEDARSAILRIAALAATLASKDR